MSKFAEIYDKIANVICEKLEKGVNPWVKPWRSVYKEDSAKNRRPDVFAYNYFRGIYHGINQALLGNGYYVSMQDIRDHKMTLKKGSKGNLVVFFNYFERKASGKEKESGYVDRDGFRYFNSNPHTAFAYNEEKGEYTTKQPNLKYYYVYSILDCENVPDIEDFTNQVGESDVPMEIHEVDVVLNTYCQNASVLVSSSYCDSAYYDINRHEIFIPDRNYFRHINNYYQTKCHELSHSTGHKNLLNRDGIVIHDSFGTQLYSKEELIAEISSAYCMGYLGLYDENVMNNSVAYLKSWAKHIKGDKSLKEKIISVTTQAQKAFELIFNLTEESQQVLNRFKGIE